MIYLIVGTNEYAIAQNISALASKIGARLEKIDAEALDANALADVMRGASLFSEKRVITIRQLSENKELWAKVGEWASDVSSDTTLILIEPKPDKRTKTYKVLSKTAQIIAADPFTDRQKSAAQRWLRDFAKAHNLSLTREQADDMLARASVPNEAARTIEIDQFQLAHAVSALANLDEITSDAIATVLPPAREFSVFDLLALAVGGDCAAAQTAIVELKSTEDAYKVMALLWAQWSQLVAVSFGGSRSSSQLAEELSLHPFVVKKTQELAEKITQDELRVLTKLAAELDAQSKTSSAAPWDIIERFILGVATRRGAQGEK